MESQNNSDLDEKIVFSSVDFNQTSYTVPSLKKLAIQAVIEKMLTLKKIAHTGTDIVQEITKNYQPVTSRLPTDLQELINATILKKTPNSSIQFKGKILDISPDHELIASEEGVVQTKDGKNIFSKHKFSLAAFCATAQQLAYIPKTQNQVKIISTETKEALTETSLDGLIFKNQSFEQIIFPEPDHLILRPVSSSFAFFWHPESSPNDIHRCDFTKGIIHSASSMPGKVLMFSKIFDGKLPKVYLANSENCNLLTQFDGFQEAINSIAYGMGYVAAGSQDKTIKLWDILSHERIAFIPHNYPVNTVEVDSYGRYMASGTGMPEGKISIWDLRMRRLISQSQLGSFRSTTYNRVVSGPHASGSINTLSFHSNGKSLMVGIDEYGLPELHTINMSDPSFMLKKIAVASALMQK